MTWQRFKLKIPKEYGPSERKAIAFEVIEKIIDRTQSGLNKNNRAFPSYSKEYIKSLDFKNAGKSPSKVNLTLSGDMLESLELISHRNGELLIGIDRADSENNDKATGHVTGIYGNSSKIKKRDFMGITNGDRDKILKKYPIKDRLERLKRAEVIIKSAEKSKEVEVK